MNNEQITTTFDFGDGRGPVPAKQHTNPDGSVGGWVALSASVSIGVFVGFRARVSGGVVSGTAIVSGGVVSGTAIVRGGEVSGTAIVRGGVVCGTAIVSGGVVCGDEWKTSALQNR